MESPPQPHPSAPPPGAAAFCLGGHELSLLPARAAWWAARRTLFVADVHLGKEASARAAGQAFPPGPSEGDLERLEALCAAHGARRLVVLGDLVHAREARGPGVAGAVAAWAARLAAAGVAVELVPGNHERRAGPLPLAWGLALRPPGDPEDSLALWHEPPPNSAAPWMAGHLHPGLAARLPGSAGKAPAAPVFWHTGGGLVLPAFGGLTGLAAVAPGAGDRVFAVLGAAVRELPPALWPRAGRGRLPYAGAVRPQRAKPARGAENGVP